EIREVDEHLWRRCSLLHHVDERLPPGQRARALVGREHRDRLVHRRRARVFDLAKEHQEIQSRARVTCQARAKGDRFRKRWRRTGTSGWSSTTTSPRSSSTWTSTRRWRP